MKKKVFTLALAILGVFAFANNSAKNSVVLEGENCVQVTLSCGIQGQVCHYTSVQNLINIVLDADNNLCPQE